MPNLSNMEPVARKALTVFYVLDTSGSMDGTPIATVNSAMDETVEALKRVAQGNADAQLRIAVLEFNSDVKWLNPKGPEDIEDYFYEGLEAGGTTEVGAALEELNDKLSRNKFLNAVAGNYMPVIIFMTDGYATDEYAKDLAKIRQNKWFRKAAKIAFAIGEDADLQMISEIVGNKEAVIRTDDLDLFARLIQFVSVTSSMLVSSTQTQAGDMTGDKVVSMAVQQGLINSNNTLTDDDSIQVTPEPNDPDNVWGDDDWS